MQKADSIMTYLATNPEKEPLKLITCGQEVYHVMVVIILALVYVHATFDPILLFLNKSTSCGHKFLIMLRVILHGALIVISMNFILLIEEFSEVIINMSALLIINEFDKIFGNFFMQRLRAYHREIIKQENFM